MKILTLAHALRTGDGRVVGTNLLNNFLAHHARHTWCGMVHDLPDYRNLRLKHEGADVFCFPSRYEGLPNVLPEATSCGLPVVASDIQEIRDIATEEGWLLKPVDDVDAFAKGLQEVFANQEAFKNLAAEAACQMRKVFSMETCAQKYLEAFQQAIAQGR